MNWKIIPSEYLNYLRETELKIPRTDYGRNSLKPFFGILFEVDDLVYVTQVSSPKSRHDSMRNNTDFLKIYNPRTNNLIGVINLNYMFPVPKAIIGDLKYKDISSYRDFRDDIQKSKYIDLLKIQRRELNNLPVKENAIKIYEDKYTYPESAVSKRCFDFKQLEKVAKNWNK